MSDNAIVVQTESRFLSPAATIEEAVARYALVAKFIQAVLKEGQDYGPIPGTGEKPTLLKPGAEKLNSLFALSPKFPLLDKELDWTGDRHSGEPFFYFQYSCELHCDGRHIASGVGSCNSWEKKYRYRMAEKTCPKCGRFTIIKGREEYGGGWLCYAKKGGCGAKFPNGDKSIEGQQVGQVKNPDPADIVNTIDKMAQKRALIAATLIATNASEYFTQDIGDFTEGDFTEADAHKPAVVVQPPEPDPIPVEHDAEPPAKPEPAKPTNGKATAIYAAVVEAKLSDSEYSARQALNKCRTGYDTPEKAVAWMRLYRGWRDTGLKSDAAAAKANAGEVPA